MNLQRAVMFALMGAPVDTKLYNHSMGGSAFNPQMLLDSTTTEQGSLVRIPVPQGTHLAVIEKVGISNGIGKDGREWVRLDVQYNIDNPDVKAALGRDKVVLTQGIMLDRKPDGALDYSKGKNVTLNRLRESVNLNEAGKPFAFRMLEGKPLNVVVTHSPATGASSRPGDVYENVSDFVKA